jgi:hypothetical protein
MGKQESEDGKKSSSRIIKEVPDDWYGRID